MFEEHNLPSWDLSSLFKTTEDCTKAVNVLQKNINQFTQSYKGKITDAVILQKATISYENIIDGIHRVGAFAYLHYITHMNDKERKKFYQKISEMLAAFSAEIAFFAIEVNNLDDKIVFDTTLDKYKTYFKNIRLYKPYELPEQIEQLLIKKSVTSATAWVKLFDETISHLKFHYNGKELTCAKIFDLLTNKQDAVRKNAAEAISKVLKDNINLFTFITNTLAKDKAIDDEMRGFKESISSRNFANFIEDDIVHALIKSVKNSYKPIAHRYYKLKAKILNKEKLEFWDRNAPMPFSSNEIFSYEEAKKITIDAYQEFSNRMARIAKAFFDKNWIDAPVRDFKDSGAFSHPCCTSANPFIMLNFLGKPRDVSTMAHELGHGIHQFLARNQGALLCQTPLTLAETASVFGEQLVFQKILKQTQSVESRLEMLSSKIEDMINTTIRQIAFCDFELKVHEKRKKHELSPEEIGNIWLDVQKESLGDAFHFADEYKYYWSYIPHFIHTPFYVYAYAFGDILVNSLYQIYLSNTVENFQEKYLTMLETGGALRHKELLAPFGIDISKQEFWSKGMSILENMINTFENEYYHSIQS